MAKRQHTARYGNHGVAIAQKILNDFENELKKFKQVCPIEMLDKLDNPISHKPSVKKAS